MLRIIGGAAVEGTYLDAFAQTTYDSNHTFTGVNFGTEASDRRLILHFFANTNGLSNANVTSVTIGGVAATQLYVGSISSRSGLIWAADVPTETSGSVQVISSTQCRWYCTLYGLTGAQQATPYDANYEREVADPKTLTLDTPGGGFLIASAVAKGSSAPGSSFDWSGLLSASEEDVDGATGSSSRLASASKNKIGGGTAQTVTSDNSSNINHELLVSSWR